MEDDSPVIVSAFHSMLLHQLVIVLVLLAIAVVAGGLSRVVPLFPRGGQPGARELGHGPAAEPVARRVLRISFGLLWLLDGGLQAQRAMPMGLPTQVVQPAAAGSPAWVHHLVNIGVGMWTGHPIQAAVATVWIQVGIGAWLLVARRANWSRLAGVAAAGWGFLVWVFGEAFGGIFGSGLSWQTGAPGAVLFYVVAGVLVALPDRAWSGRRLGRVLLSGMGVFFLGMALLQAWPGRGFWVGSVHGRPAGSLEAMVTQMSQTSQPHFLSGWLATFARFDAAHGFAVNLFVVVGLALLGVALLCRQRSVLLGAVIATWVVCLADWVLVQDLGFLGGLGTDPNSMIPLALIVLTGYLATVHRAPVSEEPVALPGRAAWRAALSRPNLTPTFVLRILAACAAAAVVLVGAAPMALASTRAEASPLVSEALDGTPQGIETFAPSFSLVDQAGRPVSLAGIEARGATVVITFLDPVGTTDDPIIAQELRRTDHLLGADSRRVEFVGIDVNPVFHTPLFTATFDRQEGLTRLSNWVYLSGPLAALQQVWSSYGIVEAAPPGGVLLYHNDLLYVIDRFGRARWILNAYPGNGGASERSSFDHLLASKIEDVVHGS